MSPDRKYTPTFVTVSRLSDAIVVVEREPSGRERREPNPRATAAFRTHSDKICVLCERTCQSVTESTWIAFQLTHIEKIPVAEAAEQLDVSPGAVYIARSRVMNRLRTLVQQFEVEP